jgi:hypothetical protein
MRVYTLQLSMKMMLSRFGKMNSRATNPVRHPPAKFLSLLLMNVQVGKMKRKRSLIVTIRLHFQLRIRAREDSRCGLKEDFQSTARSCVFGARLPATSFLRSRPCKSFHRFNAMVSRS